MLSIQIMISESYWLKNGTSSHPSYDEMIQVLYNVQTILIRAKFSTVGIFCFFGLI